MCLFLYKPRTMYMGTYTHACMLNTTKFKLQSLLFHDIACWFYTIV